MTALLFALLPTLAADGWQIDHPRPGVTVLRDENGAFGGFSMGVSHINTPLYQARKVLDLTALPAGVVARAKAARLRLYLAIQDYSWNVRDHQANGLNEAFEVVVNDVPMRFETSDPRFPSRAQPNQPLRADWVDLDLPLETLRGERLEVTIRKVPGGTDDDYIYPGIDNSVRWGHSSVTFDGRTWNTEHLNTIAAQGEYMIRLVLAENDLRATATWRPDGISDEHGLLAYHGREGTALRLEPEGGAFDPSRPLRATVTARGAAPKVEWRDRREKPLPAGADDGALTLPPGQWQVGALVIDPPEGTTIDEVRIDYELPTTEPRPLVDLCPKIAPPCGQRRETPPSARFEGDRVTLDNGALRAVFRVRPTLGLEALEAAELDRNVLARPQRARLFALKVGERVYGAADLTVAELTGEPNGFVAVGPVGDSGLQATFSARLDGDELRLGLRLAVIGAESVRFWLSFPHLAGLELSDDPADDHYLFPWGGGVIANAPCTLRTSYGENSCWWQMIDLFSPSRGGGIYLRIDDAGGLYKNPSLRKGEIVLGSYSIDETGGGLLEPEMQWRGALEPDPGIGLTFDYLRRDRGPGESFAPPDACLGTHSGDWRAAMTRYREWARRTWPPRPYPSRFTSCWHITAPGWGQTPLFKDGAYRTDYLTPRHDVAEMMSWWSWSELGPWNTPMDRLEEELGKSLYERYKAYWVRDPATGKLMYPLNRGDYDGYNPQWGGLPALRAHIERVRAAGIVPMFYTDPILACATTKLGSQYGPTYGIMNPLWKDAYNCPKTPPGYVGSYGSYNMCLDTEWYSQWVADTMARVCAETGIDGIRLDEYGHRGYVCTSDKHQHLFAEPGHNAWLQALARNVRQVHEAMDRVRPGLILTTEFPGTDHMAAALEGAIIYDLRREGPVRPTPINLFRFYFPECKVMEIDVPHRERAQEFMLWNAEAAFSAFYSPAQHALLRENTWVFETGRAEPLVPTLIPRVYANAFEGDGKRIVMVHNATGHTVDGPVLPVELGAEHHYVDLLTGRELVPGPDGAIALKLTRDQTVPVARLPRRLAVEAGVLRITGDGRAVAVDANGSVLGELAADQPLTAPAEGRPALLKLLRDGQLVDLMAWPAE